MRIKDMILSFAIQLSCNNWIGKQIFGVVDAGAAGIHYEQNICSPIQLLHDNWIVKDKIISFILILI